MCIFCMVFMLYKNKIVLIQTSIPVLRPKTSKTLKIFIISPITFFQFKFWLGLSGLLKHTIDSGIKVLNHILLTIARDHNTQKIKLSQIFLPKINWLNQLIMQLTCLMQHGRNFRVLMLKSANSKMSGSQEFSRLVYDSSNDIMYCDVCRKAGPDIKTLLLYCFQKMD